MHGVRQASAVTTPGRSHLLECQHEGCTYAMVIAAGELPARCPLPKGCGQPGFWMVSRVYVWDPADVRRLKALWISPD